MARPDFPLTILEFQQRFGTEEACREYLFASRWPEGFVCPCCGSRDGGGETRRHLWICTACGRQTSITAGTVMHKTRLSLRTWFWAAMVARERESLKGEVEIDQFFLRPPARVGPMASRLAPTVGWRVRSAMSSTRPNASQS